MCSKLLGLNELPERFYGDKPLELIYTINQRVSMNHSEALALRTSGTIFLN